MSETFLMIFLVFAAAGWIYTVFKLREAQDRCAMFAGETAKAHAIAESERSARLRLADTNARLIASRQTEVPTPAPRAVPSSRATALDGDRFTRIWRSATPETELLLAVQQLLALETVAAIDDAANPALAERPGSLAAAQGQVNALLSFAVTLDEALRTPEKWVPKA